MVCSYSTIASDSVNTKNKRAKTGLYRSAEYQTCFELMGLSAQKKKLKIDFQDGDHGSYLRFPMRMSSAIFLSTSRPNTSSQVLTELAFQFRRFKRDF